MSVIKLDQIDFSNISVYDPIKQDGLYLSKVQYNEKDLVIQLPKLTVSSRNGNDSLELIITDELKSFLDKYDQFMINLTAEKSLGWFSKELSKAKVAQIYKKNFVTCDSVTTSTFKIDENIQVYSKDKQLELDNIEAGMEVILLVHPSYLVFYKANCIPYFNVLHLKLKEKKLECDFREIEEEKKKIPIKINVDEFEFN
jgi:hypothetical protein